MAELIAGPSRIEAAGTRPKLIEEYAGRVNTGHQAMSVARMVSPSGWEEPGQRPEFEEVTVVLKGVLRVEHAGGILDVAAGQGVIARPGEWVRYHTQVLRARNTSPFAFPLSRRPRCIAMSSIIAMSS